MKSYSTFEWLLFIKILEAKNDEEIKSISNDDLESYNLKNTNWHVILIDLAIRLSDDTNLQVDIRNLPEIRNYHIFISHYINTHDEEESFAQDLNHSMFLALSKYSYEQLKRFSPIANNLGRLLELYGDIEDRYKSVFGLSPRQTLLFYLLHYTQQKLLPPFSFNEMFEIMQKLDATIKGKQLRRFFEIFSISIKDYRLTAKSRGISKTTIKCKRIIEFSPILKLANDYYFIPSAIVLLESLTYKTFEILMNEASEPDAFRRKFGEPFENYVRKLTNCFHGNFLHECHDLIVKDGQKKAEFYLLKNDVLIVIEAKVLHIDEDIILSKQTCEIEKKFKSTLQKALKQIQTSFNHIAAKEKYGIIVIHTHMPMIGAWTDFIERHVASEYTGRIQLMSIFEYESTIHYELERIAEYLDQGTPDRNFLESFPDLKNPYLVESMQKSIKLYDLLK